MIRGYARVSTKGQVLGTSLEDQHKALTAAGCQEIYEDVMSGAKMDRPGFDRLKNDLAAGDTVVVTAFDRFARTVGEAYIQVEEWFKKGVRVWILNLGVIEDTEMGRILMGIMLVFADFERRTIIRRLQGGRAYKRANDPGRAQAEVHGGAARPCRGAAGESQLYRGNRPDGHLALDADKGSQSAGVQQRESLCVRECLRAASKRRCRPDRGGDQSGRCPCGSGGKK